ncbi:MAG: Na+:solute symporter [candidate division KSB1 bacterium]|nr:Na+:solute symporter [candidate division KSB1 bacterium]MDZ7333860.1 Na+:solute symporter [candidate division KSB1 bacterium]MDZ7399106.1 Na+:solute symporter [candidate division KSB1 bacterium]
MKLSWLDVAIIFGYLVLTVFIGALLTRRASKGLASYFLADKGLPFWVLGVSNASGMFDITGTMWLVYVTFVYGLKGAFIPWLWPVFNQIFLMVYISKWMRRSNVMTGAEWISTRFGYGKGASLAHIIVVIFALVSVIGFIAYDFAGVGKFATTFLPWKFSEDPVANANWYATSLMLITAIYVVAGGMYSVVVTELLQFMVMTISCIGVALIAISQTTPAQISAAVPTGWKDLFFGWHLNLDWSGLIEAVNTKIADDGYSLFTIFLMMVIFKGILVSMAGPAPNYDMQRVLATRSPKEASKMSWFVSICLFPTRYLMITGIAVLALVFFSAELRKMGPGIDFEQILPYTLSNFIPMGLLGLILAGLLAAFMSTFAATVNAAPAYVVNDIYKRYINPNASRRTLITMSYFVSFAFVVVGIFFGFHAKDINQVTQWIVSALWGGYTAANVLKWYWWRFNGYGYFWGMATGIAAALILSKFPGLYLWIYPEIVPNLYALYSFPVILVLSLVGCLLGTFFSKPEDEEVLINFYRQVRPWGFWKPIHQKVLAQDPNFKSDANFKLDLFNVIIGTIWQTSLVVIPIYIVLREKLPFFEAAVVLVITSLILKKTWWNKLTD